MTTASPVAPRHTALPIAAAIPLLLWTAFWSWFVLANLFSDGLALPPVLVLAVLWGTAALCWWRPRLGALALLGIAATAIAGLAVDSPVRWVPVWSIAAPCVAIAALAWFGTRTRPAAN
jgi:hypothetical protein